jgi:hypothetical protein
MQGYILVTKMNDGEVVALSGGRYDGKLGPKPPREVSHLSLEECFVHSGKAIGKMIRDRRPWIANVTMAFGAGYDPKGDRVYPEEQAQPALLWGDLQRKFQAATT